MSNPKSPLLLKRAKKSARPYTKSSSFQMALFFTLLCGVTAIILGYFGYYFSQGHYVGQTEEIIDTELRHIQYLDGNNQIKQHLNADNRVHLILSKEGRVVAGNLNALPKVTKTFAEGIILFDHQNKKYAAKIDTLIDGRKVLVGVDMTEANKMYNRMRSLAILSIIFVIIVALTSYIISQFVVSGTNKIAVTAREIMDTGDLSRRIDMATRWDDLSYMGSVLNRCFDKIETLMDGISHVSDNIAHDLKTPLTRLKNHVAELSDKAHKIGDEDLANNADGLIAEADHLLNIFNALLRISRLEAGSQKVNFAPVGFDKVVYDAMELYEPIAEDKNITIITEIEDVTIHGDRDLLFQAAANLIDNAIKFTPENGTVKIELARDAQAEQGVLSITDSGIGVTEGDLEKIFDRFYRSDKSRNIKGSGLGLSLVKAIVDLHDGMIGYKNENEKTGMNFTLKFDLV